MDSREDIIKRFKQGIGCAVFEDEMKRAEERGYLRAMKEAASKPAEARCPMCGGALTTWLKRGRWECEAHGDFHDEDVWRRWGDTDKADGIHWVKRSDDRRVRAVNAAYHNLDDTHWVLGPLPEPKAPGGE